MIGELGAISNTGSQTLGGGAAPRPDPVAKPPPVTSVEGGTGGRELSADLNSGQPGTTPDRRFATKDGVDGPDTFAARRTDPDQIAGPSPAFQASVLEIETDLQNSIARIEAARAKAESDAAQRIGAEQAPGHIEPHADDRTEDAAADTAIRPAEVGRPDIPAAPSEHADDMDKAATDPDSPVTDPATPPPGAPATTAQTPQQAYLQPSTTPPVTGESD